MKAILVRHGEISSASICSCFYNVDESFISIYYVNAAFFDMIPDYLIDWMVWINGSVNVDIAYHLCLQSKEKMAAQFWFLQSKKKIKRRGGKGILCQKFFACKNVIHPDVVIL